MKYRIVAMARAHLRAACVIAMLVQVVELVCIQCGAVRPATFETSRFRLGAATVIILSVGLLRLVSYLAYRDVLRVDATMPRQKPIPVSRGSLSAWEFLARMHFHFNGGPIG